MNLFLALIPAAVVVGVGLILIAAWRMVCRFMRPHRYL
jgi:hypothetical protein